ncbi:MAG: hypothetical protein K8S25_18020 [Alphaproteobacteria bacterium]|nr:hypothetical protein [Alphaproteobacteria bacterium]
MITRNQLWQYASNLGLRIFYRHGRAGSNVARRRQTDRVCVELGHILSQQSAFFQPRNARAVHEVVEDVAHVSRGAVNKVAQQQSSEVTCPSRRISPAFRRITLAHLVRHDAHLEWRVGIRQLVATRTNLHIHRFKDRPVLRFVLARGVPIGSLHGLLTALKGQS